MKHTQSHIHSLFAVDRPGFNGGVGDADKTAPIKVETICVVTRATSRVQFIDMFRRYCTATSCFIPCPDNQAQSVGVLAAFQLLLADGTLMLHGDGVVIESWPTAANPFRRSGIRVAINRLTPESKDVFDEITVPRSTATRVPLAMQLKMIDETVPHAAPHLLDALASGARSHDEVVEPELPPLNVEATPTPPRAHPATVPAKKQAPAANPLTDMTDDVLDAFLDCNLRDDIDASTVTFVPAGHADPLAM
ncbi:MAG TPA: hypothetical protein VFQ53_24765 [Kofleriaceae bacterium]|nr:hypothetical protein [Kofleriaceae bacterium]